MKYLLVILLILIPVIALGISSSNYSLEPLNIGNSGGIDSVSAGFNLKQQQVGDFIINIGNSTNYSFRHGHLYPDSEDVKLNFTVIPEKRIPVVGNNGTRVIIYIYNIGGNIPIHSYSYYDTDLDGKYTDLVLSGISPGVYDLAVKGYAHLRKRINNVVLNTGVNTVDFTSAGTEKLLVGDIYTNGSYPDGDNTVNSVDVTYLVSKWAVNDLAVSDERADVDENGQVNSLDMTKTVNNYAVSGD